MATERLTINTLVSAANLNGSTANIDDDPDSPDGLWMTSNGAGAAELTGGFQSPSRSLQSGADLQEFRTLIRRSSQNGGPDGGFDVVFDIDLYENGSIVTNLVSGATQTSGAAATVYSGTWNSTSITNVDNVEIRVIQTSGHSGSPTNRRYLDIGAIEWNATTVDPRYIIIS